MSKRRGCGTSSASWRCRSEAGASSKVLLAIFEKDVRAEERGPLECHVYTVDGAPRSIAVPFSGPGLWGPIKGFLSLAPDMRTIRGVTFHEQEETPGLGGEIASNWFRNQFRDKKIVSDQGAPGLRIVRGRKAAAANEVDGITGATMTCDKVEAMLNKMIAQVVKERATDGE